MSSQKIKPQTLKGFRDFLPDEMRVRNFVLDTVRSVFETFGFEPLETPSLEYAETLLGKYGKEADRLVYTFADRGGRDVGMIYDLTVPVSRVLATYASNKIPLPFKRHQIQRVWRAERPQKSRYREFLQCDIDIFGSSSPLADAEIITITAVSLQKLGFNNFYIKVNNRQILFELMKKIGVADEQKTLSLIQTVDKLDKKPKNEVQEELNKKGLSQAKTTQLFELIDVTSPDKTLQEIFAACEASGVEKKFLRFDPALARGLDYYTGPIFEAVVEKPKIGSIAGGGRYDNLIKKLGGPDIPATGISFGIDRICDTLTENKLLGATKPKTKALVTIFPEEKINPTGLPQAQPDPSGFVRKSLQLAQKLRNAGIGIEVYPDSQTKLDKQLKYADKKSIPYCVILGPEEIAAGNATLKNMQTGEQQTLPPDKIPAIIAP